MNTILKQLSSKVGRICMTLGLECYSALVSEELSLFELPVSFVPSSNSGLVLSLTKEKLSSEYPLQTNKHQLIPNVHLIPKPNL